MCQIQSLPAGRLCRGHALQPSVSSRFAEVRPIAVPRRLCGRPFVLWANADAGERHEAIDRHAHIAAVMEAVRQGLLTRDTDCRCAYARDAVIFDLAPPLAQSIDVDQLANWLEGWGGPVDQKLQNSSSQWMVTLPWAWMIRVSTHTKSGEDAAWWMRATVCLARHSGDWKIVHEHTSVPFHMDGNYRAAVDLSP